VKYSKTSDWLEKAGPPKKLLFFEVRRSPHISYLGNVIESNSSDNSNGRKFYLTFCCKKLNHDTQCNCQSYSSWQFTKTMQDFSDVKTELGTL